MTCCGLLLNSEIRLPRREGSRSFFSFLSDPPGPASRTFFHPGCRSRRHTRSIPVLQRSRSILQALLSLRLYPSGDAVVSGRRDCSNSQPFEFENVQAAQRPRCAFPQRLAPSFKL